MNPIEAREMISSMFSHYHDHAAISSVPASASEVLGTVSFSNFMML